MQNNLKPTIPKAQQGAAIIIALFVTSIIAMAAIAMIDRFRSDLRRTELFIHHTKAYGYAQGSIAWAIARLNTNLKQKKPDNVADRMPMQSPTNTIEDGTISSNIVDQEGLFNLNNLVLPEWQEAFMTLIHLVAPNLSEEERQAIGIAVRDWVSPTGANSALEEYYAKQSPAYPSPHKPMASKSELRLVKGITPALYQALSPYITALPETTNVNVNTAPIPVIRSVYPTLTAEAAAAITAAQHDAPFATIEAFQQCDIVKNHQLDVKKITVISSYFLLKTEVKLADQHVTLYTLLHRLLNNAQPITVVIWQSKGRLSP